MHLSADPVLGANESAAADPVRRKRARLAAWLEGDGIEIGALHRPLDVPAGANVTYVDRLPESELRRHYPELAGQPFAPTSVIGSAENLSAFGDGSLDFVIANHLLEHLEYPIRGLLEFQRVLRPGGLLYLALPDKRQTFDRSRAVTTVEHLLNEHRTGSAERNRRAHYLDWAINVDGRPAGPEAQAHADRLMEAGYSIHFHVWHPDSFLDFLVAARSEAGIELELLQFAAPEFEQDDEFILLLARKALEVPRLPPPTAAEAAGGIGAAHACALPHVEGGLRSRLAGGPLAPAVRAARILLRRPRA